MSRQIVRVEFILHGEIELQLFKSNLKSWIKEANDQLLTARIEYQVVGSGDKRE